MPAQYPPGPRDYTFGVRLGRRLNRQPLEFLTQLQCDYGDLVYMKLGPYKTYWLFHPDLARDVLVSKAKHFRRLGRQVDVLKQWNGDSLVTSDGDSWLRQRRLVQPAFAVSRFARYAQSMVGAAQRLADRWQQSDIKQLEISQAMTAMTLEIIAATMFDVNVAEETRKLGEAVCILSEIATRELGQPFTLPLWLPLPSNRRKRWAMEYLDSTIRRIIRERRASGQDKGDLLSMLLHAVDAEGDGKGMTDEQARNQSMTLLLAGHDTTAGTLAWLWYLLAAHPEIEARVIEEIAHVLPDRSPTAEDLPRLSCLERVVKETLRLYPQAYVLFARVADDEVPLGDYVIPKGGMVYVSPYVIQRDARWFPDPDKFDPERFSPERHEQLPTYAYIPFGAGPRVCIGAAFATMEMVLTTATLLQRYRLALAPGQQNPEPLPLFSLKPKGGVQMTLARRSMPQAAGATA
jgi:cytochrome P450